MVWVKFEDVVHNKKLQNGLISLMHGCLSPVPQISRYQFAKKWQHLIVEVVIEKEWHTLSPLPQLQLYVWDRILQGPGNGQLTADLLSWSENHDWLGIQMEYYCWPEEVAVEGVN